MILTVLAVVLLPVHLPVWAATTAYAFVCGPGALEAMEQAEAQGVAYAARRPADLGTEVAA